MAYQPQLIDLDQHHRYGDYKENRYQNHRSSTYGGSNRGSVYQKVDLDQFSSDDEGVTQVPPGGIVYDDLTTTSGSDFVPSEVRGYGRSRKFHARERHLGSNFPSMSTIHHKNYDDYDDFAISSEDDSQDTPPRIGNLQLVSPLTPFAHNHRRRQRNLEMIEEISPVLPSDRKNESDELPPKLKPLQLSKTWNPIQTSTTTSFIPPPPPIPKTNPRHVGLTSTPRSAIQPNFNGQRYGFDDIDGPQHYMQQRPAKVFAKPDHFGLPSQVAEKHQSRGIMDLSIKIRRLTVVVTIQKATYFLDPSRPITSFVKVELKPHPTKKLKDPNPRKRKAREAHRYFDSFKTDSAAKTNCPVFGETFKFKLSEANIRANDVISISVFSRIQNLRSSEAERELLGCMAFPLINLFKKADLLHDHRGGYIESSDDYVPVARGGFFLLGKMYGSKNHLSEQSIRHSKYYDEIGGTSISTCSSSGISSPIKSRMMGEHDWRATPRNRQETVLTRLGVSPLKDGPNTRSGPISLDYMPAPQVPSNRNYYGSSSGSSGYPGPKKRTSLTNALVNGTDSPCTSSSGSSGGHIVNNGMYEFSTSNSSYSTNSGPDFAGSKGATNNKRFTMPSIMTTSDTELPRPSDCQRGQPVDLDLLYADTPMTFQPRHLASIDDDTTHEGDDDDDSEADDIVDPARMRFDSIGARELQNDALKVAARVGGHNNVRRVASFTSPPTKNQVAKASQQKEREQRRGFFGKTLNFFRNKGTMSSQVIYPSIEEAKTWAEKMETLLESKTGVLFFAQFLDNEYSRENLDFSLKCREYKKLFRNPKKNQKKIARLAKDIYDQFLDDCAPQEVNLEASVRSATRAALNEELREDTLSLAQNKIEQLLANDKYQRFLKSDIYQDLINRLNGGSTISVQSAHPELPLSSSDGESTPCATANEETPLAPNQGDRKTLRSASAVDRIED